MKTSSTSTGPGSDAAVDGGSLLELGLALLEIGLPRLERALAPLDGRALELDRAELLPAPPEVFLGSRAAAPLAR